MLGRMKRSQRLTCIPNYSDDQWDLLRSWAWATTTSQCPCSEGEAEEVQQAATPCQEVWTLYKLGYNLGMQGNETTWCWESPCGHVGPGCNKSKNCARNSSMCKNKEYQMMAEHKEFVEVNDSAGLPHDELIMPNKKLLSQPIWSWLGWLSWCQGQLRPQTGAVIERLEYKKSCRHSAIEARYISKWLGHAMNLARADCLVSGKHHAFQASGQIRSLWVVWIVFETREVAIVP